MSNREMGGYIGSVPAFYGSSLGSNPDISKIYTKKLSKIVNRQIYLNSGTPERTEKNAEGNLTQ